MQNERKPLLGDRDNENEDETEVENQDKIDMRSFLTACAANMYEYYDFALLGFYATEISSTLFPSGPGAAAIIQLYFLYAVGFIARPFGGIVFGYFGDKYGRSSSLRMGNDINVISNIFNRMYSWLSIYWMVGTIDIIIIESITRIINWWRK